MTKLSPRSTFARPLNDESDDGSADRWSLFAGVREGIFAATSALARDPGGIQISLTGGGIPYTQNFDTLAITGTSSALPTDWAFSESLANANTSYTAGTGSGTAGDTYSFGAASATDRAFGTLQSGSLLSTIGASFTNNTGATITSLALSYIGEQWRLGAAGRVDRLDFQISFNATSLTTGTWTNVDSLDFVAPVTAGATGALDGNAAANRTAISSSITSLTLANGATFWIRWVDLNAAGADDGLAIDDFSITPTTAPALPNLSIDDVTMTEGDAGITTFTFTVSLSAPAGPGGVTFDIATADGTATDDIPAPEDNDYVALALTGQTIPEGSDTYSFSVTVNGDAAIEPDELFFVNVTNVVGATVADGQGTGTITNDDAPPVPSVSIGDATVVETDDGVSYLIFTVSLSQANAGPVTVDFTTADGTATAGSDYLARTGQLTFEAGETIKAVVIPVIGDGHAENDETLIVTLSNPSGATMGDGSAVGTITNDDGALYYSLAGGSFSQNWGNIGQIATNDNWSGVPFIIGYRGDDLTTATGTDARTITTTSNVIDVNANQSNPDTFLTGGVTEFHIANPVVGLTGSGTADAPYIALYMDATGRSDIRVQANIRDLDASADDAAQQINVQYRTNATGPWLNAPGGYFADVTTANSATQVTALDIILPADANGAAALEIRIMTTNAAGNDEYVGVDDIVVSSQLGAPSLSIENAAVIEGDSGTSAISFTVTRAGDSAGAVSAAYAVNFGSGPFDANAGDFAPGEPFTGTVDFADGQTTATIVINVQGDMLAEGDDSFTVTLSSPTGGASIVDGSATGTIVNDDDAPSLVTINDVTVTEGDAGTSVMTFTVVRSDGSDAFSVDYATADGSATSGEDYVATSGTLNFGVGETTQMIGVTINGDTDSEFSETLQVLLSNATNGALITDGVGIGTIASDDPIFIHDIQGTAYFSPILAGEGIGSFNTASAGTVVVRAIVTAVDNDGPRQGYYLTEETTDWDGNSFTSEGIFVMTRDDNGNGIAVSGVAVGDLIQVTAQVMEYQAFQSMPRTVLVNSTGLSVISSGNSLSALTVTLTNMPNAVLTGVTPDHLDSSDGAGDTFDASLYALSYFETVEGMLVTIPDMVVADGFVESSGGRPFLQAYSLQSANPDQINSRGGYTIAGDPPVGPPDTAQTGDDTNHGGRHLHDGDVNPDIIELDFTGFAMAPPPGLAQNATMGDQLGDVTGIIDFDFTDRKLFVTGMEPGGFVNGGIPERETTALGDDDRSLTVATFNVENLDPGDGAARFAALADAIANNLNAPDIICIEEIQDNNGAASGGTDASTTWQMLVDALNLATGKHYQWVDQEPNGSEGGEPGGNIRVGFLYDTGRVQLGDLDANATLAERRQYTDRIGDGVRDAGDLIAFSDDMIAAEINTADWSSTRRSLLGEFNFNGNTVYVTANHFTAKGGSGQFWQFDQDLENGDPENAGWAKRNEQAQDVYSMLNLIEGGAPGVGIVAGGDFNDFYFYRPLTTLTGYTMADGSARAGGARFDNLTLTLSEAERYTYTFDGRAQAIDHIIANNLLGGVATYDVVHINTGYNGAGTGPDASPRLSDHDPGLSSFDFREFSEVLRGTAGADSIEGFGGNDIIIGLAGNDAIDGGSGIDTAAFAGNVADYAIVGDYDANGNLIGFLQVTDLNTTDGDEGTDTLESVEILEFADATLTVGSVFPVQLFDGNGDLVASFTSIQGAIDAAQAGYRIEVATGTYAENLVVDVEGLTIEAAPGAVLEGTFLTDNSVAGPLNEWLKTAVAYDGSAGAGMTIAADDVTINGLTISGFLQAIVLGNGTDGLTLDGVTLESNFTGIHKPGSAAVTGFEMLGGSISDGHLGMDIVRDSGSAGVLDGVTIDGTSFADLNRKGIYVEALSNAVIVNITMTNVGEFGGIVATGSLGAGGNGINLNLKYDDYANILIENFTMTDVGSSDRDGAVAEGHQNGGAIVVAARDDAPSYSGDPATLVNMVIRNGNIDGTSTGIQLGEPGKANATPDVLVENVVILHAQNTLRHGEIGNQSDATMTVEGTAGNDTLIASGNSDGAFVINGHGGNDTIAAGSAADVISGGVGSDLLYGRAGDDVLIGGADNDLLDGGAGLDTAEFAGTVAFSDTVIGWVVTSAEGNDFLQNVEIAVEGSGQRNLLVGSTGFAGIQAAFDSAEIGDIVRLASGTYAGSWTYDDAGLVVIAQPNARINGTFTTAGSDGITIFGANLADTITTGAGNDRLHGGAGNDTMAGGAGDDWYFVDGGDTVVEGALEGTGDRVFAGTSYTLSAGAHVEILSTTSHAGTAAIDLGGNELNNLIYGNAGDNRIDGHGGGDVMVGFGGNDWYYVDHAGDRVVEGASEGTGDRVFAGASYTLNAGAHIEIMSTSFHAGTAAIDLGGNELGNLIYGNAGSNVLDGKGGSDTLIGNGGADTFAFTTALGAGNVDILAGFGADDTIALDDAVFTGLGLGALDPNAFVIGTAAQDADDRIVYDQATGRLYYDADGNGAGAAVQFATLAGAPIISASDFQVI